MKKSVILHIGLGAFHRAHQAFYLHQLQEKGKMDWSLISGNIRRDDANLLSSLKKSGGQYYLETINPQGKSSFTLIKSISEVIKYQPNLADFIKYGSDPATKIISFTVTEGGYYLDFKDQLDLDAEEIDLDINHCKKGKLGHTIYGALYSILKKRREKNKSAKVSLMSCDNLIKNGDRFKAGLQQFLKAVGDSEMLEWIEKHCTYPNSMVDRITPRASNDVVNRVFRATGQKDECAIMSEDFIQWVIEDSFANGRPKWEDVGVQVVGDVHPYERAKICVLNATHSCIAWAGTLLGYDYIHQGVLDQDIRKIAFDYITEGVIPLLKPSPVDLEKYRDTVLERFANASIADTNQRVAMDSFAKIPGFITPIIREKMAIGQPIDSVVMLPALFLAFLKLWHLSKVKYEYQDKLAKPSEIHSLFIDSTPADSLKSFCSNKNLWGDLAGNPDFIKSIEQAYDKVLLLLK